MIDFSKRNVCLIRLGFDRAALVVFAEGHLLEVGRFVKELLCRQDFVLCFCQMF